jgi:signal peptidase I
MRTRPTTGSRPTADPVSDGPDLAPPSSLGTPATPDSPDERPTGGAHARSRTRGGLSGLREFAFLTIAALAIAIVLKTFLVQAFYIPSISMVPTLEVGDRILVNRLAYRLGDIERGDVVVFADPNPDGEHERGLVGGVVHFLAQGIGIVRPDDDDFIKRVIGLPGEVIEIRAGTVFVDGRAIDEPYVNPRDLSHDDLAPTTVPDGMLFVMGDNRNHSGDSRYQPPAGLGFVPIDRVIGKAVVIVWPPSRIGGI